MGRDVGARGILLCRVGVAGAVAGERRANSDSATNIRGDESGAGNKGVPGVTETQRDLYRERDDRYQHRR
jgi:hypothetical protein